MLQWFITILLERIVQFERHPEDSRHSVEITELEPDNDNDVEGEKEKNVEIRVTKPSLTEEELQLQHEEVKKMLECKMKKDTHKEVSTTQHSYSLELLSIFGQLMQNFGKNPIFISRSYNLVSNNFLVDSQILAIGLYRETAVTKYNRLNFVKFS